MSLAISKKPSTDKTHKRQSNNNHSRYKSNYPVHQSASVMPIQRKPPCPCGGGCPRCQQGKLPIQAKLKIGAPNDKYEQEADRVADKVMRMSEARVQRQEAEELEEENEKTIQTKLLIGQITPLIQRTCAECEEEKEESIQTKTENGKSPQMNNNIESGINALRGGGQPLNKHTQEFFGSRMGADFSVVRVHTDVGADNLNRNLSAKAFTTGNDIFFSRGRYNPYSSKGKELLGHELTHVVQQGAFSGIQRKEEDRSVLQIIDFPWTGRINTEGTGFHHQPRPAQGNTDYIRPDFNLGDSVTVLGKTSMNWLQIRRTINGVTQEGYIDWRYVDFVPQQEEQPKEVEKEKEEKVTNVCGPDATDWFIDQVAQAKADKAVLNVKADLDKALKIMKIFGISAKKVAEGGVLVKKVLPEWSRAGRPKVKPKARSQLTKAILGKTALNNAIVKAGNIRKPIRAALIIKALMRIRRAGQNWTKLVGPNEKFDFKNRSETMESPKSQSCPVKCPSTITFCPNTGYNCYSTEAPGNLFYAHVGKYVGWSELALQLGSQFAQLKTTKDWDLPEDTLMISLGFSLTDPLTRSVFCKALNKHRSSFTLHSCVNCSEPTSAQPV